MEGYPLLYTRDGRLSPVIYPGLGGLITVIPGFGRFDHCYTRVMPKGEVYPGYA